ncbi:MAG: DNA repair protein RadA [Pseudobdellovibrionaceae bacterium]|nr:DNA repair protein RadA [Bdellovibrionales bacterium]USN46164.1 MAG: DNA repair protein RadA [Pseudobdellovibrionaceae bacterium]
MAKTKSLFFCQSCGAEHPKWQGQCRECGAWNTLVEERISTSTKGGRGWSVAGNESVSSPKKLVALDSEDVSVESSSRCATGFSELDRVLGGGLVRGSYILLGGDPGIGKSTLLLQMAGGLAKNNLKVMYISGEESVGQTVLRAQRLGVKEKSVHVASESRLENILALAKDDEPDVLIVDSIQTVYLSDITSAPGSVSQVRECASQLMALAKGQNMSVFVIGHVTKEGSIAGPKTLEHMVDTVLSFEGDNSHQFRLLRALKNRFGATNELGVFQMNSQGLEEVENPSELFLEERGTDLQGSVVFAAMEGTRPLLCEVQCLTSPSPMAMPRRTSLGFDTNRVHLLVAVLDKHLDLELSRSDVFVNVVGGLRLSEPAADLAVAAAMVSTSSHREINAHACFFGEVGLTGEIRAVTFADSRLKEAEKLGFRYFVLPASNKKHLRQLERELSGEIFWLKHISELPRCLKLMLESK